MGKIGAVGTYVGHGQTLVSEYYCLKEIKSHIASFSLISQYYYLKLLKVLTMSST